MVGNGQWEGNTNLKLPKLSFLDVLPLWQLGVESGEF